MKLKNFLPKSLFGRFLLIVVAPILIVQIVGLYVFFYTHIDLVSKYMARSLVSEMAFVKKSFTRQQYLPLLNEFSENIDLKFYFEANKELAKQAESLSDKSKIFDYFNPSPIIDPLNRFKIEMQSFGLTPFAIYKNNQDHNRLFVKVKVDGGVLTFDILEKRITNSSQYVFAIWMLSISAIAVLIAILFLKNQIRSIKNLTVAANKFGRGQELSSFKPSGSKEIRSAGLAFIKMKERIKRQIEQRTNMLSSVSHDLRTPLTRMKIQLEMMQQSEEVEELKQDILDMEKLVEEYLNFARGDDKEQPQTMKIKAFLQRNIVSYYKKMNKIIEAEIDLDDNLKMAIRKTALKRALNNFIDNGFNYGKKVSLKSFINGNNLVIIIDDNGKGVAKEERDNIFKPFYRLDEARNLDKSGSGLGLSIAMSAITAHGGRIKLDDSPLGGLRVIVYLPV